MLAANSSSRHGMVASKPHSLLRWFRGGVLRLLLSYRCCRSSSRRSVYVLRLDPACRLAGVALADALISDIPCLPSFVVSRFSLCSCVSLPASRPRALHFHEQALSPSADQQQAGSPPAALSSSASSPPSTNQVPPHTPRTPGSPAHASLEPTYQQSLVSPPVSVTTPPVAKLDGVSLDVSV